MKISMNIRYDVFTRTWWREAESGIWPDNLEPHAGKKDYIIRGVKLSEAIEIAEAYNDTHEPGRYSLKAEFEEA